MEANQSALWCGVYRNDMIKTVSHTCALLHDWIFIFGGYTHWPHATSRLYAIQKDTLEGRSFNESMGPSPRYGHSGTVLDKDRWLIIGGHTGNEYVDTCHIMHCKPEEGQLDVSWDHKPIKEGSGPTPRHNHCATLLHRKVYVYGGSAYGKLLNDMYVLELEDLKAPARDRMIKWVASYKFQDSPAPSPRQSHVLIPFGDDTLVTFGGQTGDGSEQNVWTFDVPSKQWKTLEMKSAEGPKDWNDVVATVFDPSRMLALVCGGGEPYTWMFDFMNRSWNVVSLKSFLPDTSLPPYQTIRAHSLLVSANTLGEVFIVGGESRHVVLGKLFYVKIGYEEDLAPVMSDEWVEATAGSTGVKPKIPDVFGQVRACKPCLQCGIM